MNKDSIISKLDTKKVKDYSFIIFFFLIFSFFVAFAIKPNLTTIFTLQNELRDLNQLDDAYDSVISQILSLQSIFENNRDRMYLLTDALPEGPTVSKVIDDLSKSASASGVVLQKVEINQVNLRKTTANKNLQAYVVNINTNSQFEPVRKFMYDFLDQRRLKMVKSLTIVRDTGGVPTSTGSAKIQIKMEVEGYYL